MKKALVSMLWMTLLACSGHAEEPQKKPETMTNNYTRQTRINDVMNDAVFGDYGRLIFPVNTGYWSGTTLEQLALTWYNYIDPDKTVEVCNYLRAHADNCFIDIYTEAEKQTNPDLRNTGLFFFRGNSNAPFAICNAGGGFSYVGAMHDSFPHALELSKQGYNAFALIYRPGDAYEDLARAITYIYDHADELGVSRTGYSLWGGSAGARMAATLGNSANLRSLTGRTDLPQSSAVIMQYTGYTTVSPYDGPTYAAPRLRPRHWHRSRRLAPRCRPLLAEPVRCNSHPFSKSKHKTTRFRIFLERHPSQYDATGNQYRG